MIDAGRADEVELLTSRALLVELARILRRAKFTKIIAASGLTLDELVLGYADLATIVDPPPIAPIILNDPDDDHVLACAVAAQTDFIVSGDTHLLNLKAYQSIPIVTAAEALTRLLQR